MDLRVYRGSIINRRLLKISCEHDCCKLLCREEGIALMMTLWILVFLFALVMEFTHASRTEINTTKNFLEEIRSYYIARSGINLAVAEILQDAEYHTFDEKKEEVVFGRKNNTELELMSSANRNNIQLQDGWFSYSIKDENGKLNLNIIPRATIVKILETSGLGIGSLRDTIADSILDWRDKDHLHRFNGAEDKYYLSLSPPYESKDGFFENVHELLLVKGMTPEILHGSQNVDESDRTEDNLLGIFDMLTVQNIEFININTTKKEVLEVLFPPLKVQKILDTRETEGKYDNSKSSHFVVESTGHLNNSSTQRTIKVYFEKIGYGSEAFLLTEHWNDNKIE